MAHGLVLGYRPAPGATPQLPVALALTLAAPGAAPQPVAPTAPAATERTSAALAAGPAAEPPAEADAAAARARVEARVRADFARHFEYPALARRMGWGGEVLLSYRIEPDGTLDAIRVARSSGFAVLDRSALEALARVPPLTEQRLALAGRTLDLQLAVAYRLED